MDNTQDNHAAYSLYISNLIHRLQEGNALSVSEQQDLDEWRKPAGREAVFQELMDRKQFVGEVKKVNDTSAYDSEAAVRTIFGRLGLPLKAKRIVMTRRWVAAAAVLVLIASVYLLLPKQDKPGREVTLQTPIAPGGNKAVLTLGNGSTIVLDTAKVGTLAQQGSTQIVNAGNGKLAYEAGRGPVGAVTYNTLSTPRGGQYQLVLPDGSRIWLNAASSVTYPTAFTGDQRVVKITGEAYLEVARNTKQPFRVEAGGQLVDVLGTSFNLNNYGDEPVKRTTLVEGKVRVQSNGVVRELVAGQQAAGNGGELAVLSNVNVDAVLAWKNGAFSFNGADLPAVMRQLSRWYDIEVEYPAGVPAGTFDGEIGRGLSLNQVLEGLSKTRINYTIVNAHKIVIRP